ncbi:MAG: arylsulfatase [Blastocatellia bacterium]|nr:arylsulfatase [Blastocatellia bacterium]
MNLRHSLFVLASALLLIPLVQAQSQRPNIVIILADDLGYGDVKSFNPNSKIPTPHLDKLAREGLRFTDAHSPSSVCTPTRYGLLTGRYPWRSRLKAGVLPPLGLPLIEAGRLTLPAMLKQQGYATAIVGKWHLGWDWATMDGKPAAITPNGLSNVNFAKPVANGPLTRGFDYFYGVDIPNFPPYVFIENDRTIGTPTEAIPTNNPDINRKGPMMKGWDPVKILPAITDRAVRYVEEHAKASQPFFLYFALTSPHYPVVPTPEFMGKSQAGVYGDFVVQTDAAIDAVMKALQRAGADKNTLVIFTSDNGPEVASEVKIGAYARIQQSQHASMANWRGVKRDAWEGGHRVPFIARWPGKIPAGKTNRSLIGHSDLMASIAALTGFTLPSDAAPDSFNQLPALLKNKTTNRGELVYHEHNGHLALRQGDWVFIDSSTCGDGNKEPEWFRQARGLHHCAGPGALYNLKTDPTQSKNLYNSRSDKAREMKARLDQIRLEERRS